MQLNKFQQKSYSILKNEYFFTVAVLFIVAVVILVMEPNAFIIDTDLSPVKYETHKPRKRDLVFISKLFYNISKSVFQANATFRLNGFS